MIGTLGAVFGLFALYLEFMGALALLDTDSPTFATSVPSTPAMPPAKTAEKSATTKLTSQVLSFWTGSRLRRGDLRYEAPRGWKWFTVKIDISAASFADRDHLMLQDLRLVDDRGHRHTFSDSALVHFAAPAETRTDTTMDLNFLLPRGRIAVALAAAGGPVLVEFVKARP
jgi:hypothetical protein